jgi:hypothetical protein
MLSQSLIHDLRNLNRVDKLRAVQVLVTELALEEETLLIPGGTYEILTPFGNEAAAQVLQNVLEASRNENQ